MKKDIKPIRGQQTVPPTLNPNPIGPECIQVTKVYDWVVLTNRDRNKVPIPDACFAEIENCRHLGNNVTATCSLAATTPPDVLGTRPANIPGVPGANIVTLAFHAHIRIQFLCNGTPLPGCEFVVPVSFVDDVILCNPPGTTIEATIFDVQCSVVLNQMLGNMVVIDVVMCKDIQVVAPVKLEVEAKFCGPRPAIPLPEEEVVCPIPTFPQQCPTFFPPLNCACQGLAEFAGFATITVTEDGLGGLTSGTLDFAALVCDQCDLANSSLQVTFVEDPGSTLAPSEIGAIDQSFTFTSDEFNQPVCALATLPGGLSTLTVTGTGVITPEGGVPENATFLLALSSAGTTTLTITGATTTVAIALSTLTNTGLTVDVGPCSRF
ncbi:hypothetical protein QFZ28_003999 [Neobacillus niacini]|uniref:hypothetical protein n=1 Tax=Neobacillus niacini TaxID=86668 RepID=UPI002782CC86|nr:hypothetical protein [Neobacillus niacini]MDQ1003599.1 hypothetical protein [Neobacillus niacini]